MVPWIDLSKLTAAEKDALILSLLPLAGQLEAALARIAELEARLAKFERPGKTPDTSLLPPSQGHKPDRPGGGNPTRVHCPMDQHPHGAHPSQTSRKETPRFLARSAQSQGACAGADDCKPVPSSLRPRSRSVSQGRPIIPASVSRFSPISARPAADECKPLHLWMARV